MTGRIFIDSNVLIYALDPRMPEKRRSASDLVRQTHKTNRLVTSPQTLNECYRVLTDRLAWMSRADARDFVRTLLPTCRAPLDRETVQRAFVVQDETGFSWWDCVMMASALQANCRVFATEDLDDGREIDQMIVLDPFRHDLNDILER